MLLFRFFNDHLEVYCFFLLFQHDLVVSHCNQQKQVIFILVIQLSKETAPKYASEISQNS